MTMKPVDQLHPQLWRAITDRPWLTLTVETSEPGQIALMLDGRRFAWAEDSDEGEVALAEVIRYRWPVGSNLTRHLAEAWAGSHL